MLKPHVFADYGLESILCSLKLLHAAKWEQFWKKCTEVVERVHSFIQNLFRKVDEEGTKSKIPHPNMYVEKRGAQRDRNRHN